ncbi:capsid protein [Helcococcus kunzii]|uniref:capsid protein n=1 Tax=Helcococcus kunzii TaxID=40091 RepID=UPI0038AF367D
MAVKIYTKQYAGMLPDVFAKKQHFLRTFGGTVQVVDGITNKENFMDLKVSDTDVVIQKYSTDANVGFGTGTGKSSRFGERKEIKSIDEQVKYDEPLTIHEGIDDVTVNDNADQVISERAGLHAEAWVEEFNGIMGKALSDNASETLEGELTEKSITKVFAEAHKKFVNNKVSKDITWIAYCNADVYDFLVDNKLATSSKNSSANIDNQEIRKFKGFVLEELADDYFEEGEQVYFAADNIGVVGLGIQVYRLMDAEDFAGVLIQSLAKPAKYIPEKNKKAVLKAKLTEAKVEEESL